ncbi:MAG TPA: response regulator [Afifellaceae bacterium]|nr:response regulator [Afifellaceae bacterium]
MTGKILISDDEPHIRRLIEQSLEELEDEGVEILSTADGQEAIDRITQEAPDLIILDVMMPKINGFDVCERVKSDDRLRSAYVMLLTAKGQEYDRLRGEQVGADRYMTKPFDPDELLAFVREILAARAG